MSSRRFHLIAAFSLAGLLFSACKTVRSASGSKSTNGPAGDHRWANAWNEKDARTWYETTEGSHLIPWDLFMALEQKDSEELFASKANLKKYGWVYPEDPNGSIYQASPELPLGFLKDKSTLDGKDYFGWNCAACHTGEIYEDGRQILVHGGVTMVKVDEFLKDLRDTVIAHQEKAKFERMKQRIPQNAKSSSTIDSDFQASLSSMDSIHRTSIPSFPFGPGRLDAVGSILNTVSAEFTGIPANLRPIQAPVSTPVMWRVPDMACVQTNCLATNPLTRNIGQVLGAFGHINLKEGQLNPSESELLLLKIFSGQILRSTPKVANLYAIEEALKTMPSPKWEETFGALDASKVAAGEKIYAAECASCHVNLKDGLQDDERTPPNKVGARFIKVARVPRDEIGTDPLFLNSHGSRLAASGIMGDVLVKLNPAVGQAPKEMPAMTMLGLATIVVSERYFRSEEFRKIAIAQEPTKSPEDAIMSLKLKWINGQVDSVDGSVPSYKARPLDGIAFTGPYLHNGSVRTLRDLLEKPEIRPKSFRVGQLSLDKANVGFNDGGDFVLDTSVPGNSKQGHSYGTNLRSDDKDKLLEFLKSL